ncbi:hypothetical protein [Alkanindiges hydrocarboniclasticus]|uniref:hypothetical protein n=1 Tax=Alkanindiges hydrocarboniclasticus TaxID=1907941 RepID=UPI0009F89E7F|nr:hypothetical protein [Alkanindiges hydrocarboniclasticus]
MISNTVPVATHQVPDAAAPNAAYQLGDIFYKSWGYDQTNVNFYQVTGKKGRVTLLLRELAKDTRYIESMSGYSSPIKDNFIDEPEFSVRVTSLEQHGLRPVEFQAGDAGQQKYKEYYFTCYA